MKSIALDFKNNMICFMTAGQQGTETNPYLKKVAFNSFIPEQFRDKNSFTWNFENETFAVNRNCAGMFLKLNIPSRKNDVAI